VALPAELTPAQRRELAQGIAQALADRYGTAGTLAVHTPDREGDQRNHHAHILMTTRRLEPSGELGEKTRELDDVKRGPQEVEWVRAMIEARTNHALERAGSAERVDRRSLVEQRAAALEAGELERAAELDRLPTIHEGPRVTAIRRECEREQRAPLAPVTRLQVNNDRRQLAADRAELGSVSAQIIDIEQARAERAAR
ncbi:MobA/MobL family protein, partial [Pseudomonas sp. WS 5412]|nr:MobA/MobL family protein [Pseudomonas sp. WS 5412]